MCAAWPPAISHASPQGYHAVPPWGSRGMGGGWGGGRERRDTAWWEATYHTGPQAHCIDLRMELHGLDVGDKLLSRGFVEPVELLGAIAARVEAAHKLGALSPGMGIPSDLSIIWDGVSIGARNFSRYETLYLVGVVFMEWPQACRGSLARRLAGAAAGGSPPTIDQLLFFSGAVGWSQTHRAAAGRLAFVCVGHAPRGPDEASAAGALGRRGLRWGCGERRA